MIGSDNFISSSASKNHCLIALFLLIFLNICVFIRLLILCSMWILAVVHFFVLPKTEMTYHAWHIKFFINWCLAQLLLHRFFFVVVVGSAHWFATIM